MQRTFVSFLDTLDLVSLGKRGLALLVLTGLSLSLVACARVKPYERGRLAKSDMRWDGDAELLGGQKHATDYREGSNGGYGGGGGGCGCN